MELAAGIFECGVPGLELVDICNAFLHGYSHKTSLQACESALKEVQVLLCSKSGQSQTGNLLLETFSNPNSATDEGHK